MAVADAVGGRSGTADEAAGVGAGVAVVVGIGVVAPGQILWQLRLGGLRHRAAHWSVLVEWSLFCHTVVDSLGGAAVLAVVVLVVFVAVPGS